MPGNTPPDRQPHLSVPLPLPLSRRLLLSLRCLAGDDFFFFFGPRMFRLDGSEEERKKKKRSKNNIGEERKRETASQKCINMHMFGRVCLCCCERSCAPGTE